MMQTHNIPTRKRSIKSFFYTLLNLLLICHAANADNQPSAEELLRNNLAAVIEVLQKQDLDQETKNNKIVEIFSPMFDFSLMAKLTLGKKYWPGLTPEQQEKFTQLFIKRLRASYLGRLTLYTDETVHYEPPIEVNDKIHIPTYLVSKDKKIDILYKFYKSEANWKIYDLEIQGVSIVRSYRSQFYEILKSGTFDDLLIKLEQPVQN